MDNFLKQYIGTALWSSTDDDGTALDRDHGIEDLTSETLEKMKKDCELFQSENEKLIQWALSVGIELDTIAHDFWLTRNRHGVGFWDGDYPQDLGRALTDSAHNFGEVNLGVDDDGKIFQD